nr:hypothetical protein [Tanacetum cinerariifolium]
MIDIITIISSLFSFRTGSGHRTFTASSIKCNFFIGYWNGFIFLHLDIQDLFFKVYEGFKSGLVLFTLLSVQVIFKHMHISKDVGVSLVLRIDYNLSLVENVNSEATEVAWTLSISMAMRDRMENIFPLPSKNPRHQKLQTPLFEDV